MTSGVLTVPCCRWPRCSYNKAGKKIVGKGGLRWYKNVGLGFRTPKEAIEGEPSCCRAVRRTEAQQP